jgi:hypothetical protein
MRRAQIPASPAGAVHLEEHRRHVDRGAPFCPLDQAGRRYPLVVQLRTVPGTPIDWILGLERLVQVLTARVRRASSKLRGSIGYGNAFYRDMVGGLSRMRTWM